MGSNNHKYYRTELNGLHGPSGIAGLYDVLATGLMKFFAPGAASTTNFLVSLADYAQVHIARTKLLGDPDATSTEGEIARQRRLGAMAWTQVLAGAGGLTGFFLDKFNSNRNETEASNLTNTGLSISSLFASLTMASMYSEKMLVATTSKGKKTGHEIKGMILDANNDMRAFFEYLIMSAYPWTQKVNFMKDSIDFIVPVLAIRDGLCNFVNDGVSKVFAKKLNTPLPKWLKKFLRYTLLITNGDKNSPESLNLSGFLGSKLFLGKNGIRNKLFVPFFEFLGCKNVPQIGLVENDRNKFLNISHTIQNEPPQEKSNELKQDTEELQPVKSEKPVLVVV